MFAVNVPSSGARVDAEMSFLPRDVTRIRSHDNLGEKEKQEIFQPAFSLW
jgi:hypothetical protein